MRPPICCICNERFNPREEGGLVEFKKTEEDIKWDKEMKEKDITEHLPYADWFCGEHYKIAKKLKHLTIKKAIEVIKKMPFRYLISIDSISAREILDSRGNPTVEVEVIAKDIFGKQVIKRGVAPSGASTGMHEAVELRDGGKRYLGKGVLKAVENVNKKIAPKIIEEEKKLDEMIAKNAKFGIIEKNPALYDKIMCELDGSENKKILGANAIVATSMAITRAIAECSGEKLYKYISRINNKEDAIPGYLMNRPPSLNPGDERMHFKKSKELIEERKKSKRFTIPTPMLNIINGGKHAGGKLAIQEFMIIPQLGIFKENIRAASEIYHILGKILVKKYGLSARNIGDEGGYVPPVETAEDVFSNILDAIEEAGYTGKVKLGIDAAATYFYKQDAIHPEKSYYLIKGESGEAVKKGKIKPEELLEYYKELVNNYPLISIEDPFYEEDFGHFAMLTKELRGKCQIVGDDLLTTNPKRIRTAIEKESCNALLLKINQIGTVSEALEAGNMCRKEGWCIIVSHRSGETEDNFISDFAVGIGADYIKAGAPARGERTTKYNQLLRIEEEIEDL